jgi:hypothetical protein
MMKTNTMALAISLCLGTLFLGQISAAGRGSGNGNGDAAFALQRISSQAPGMSQGETLLKAFEESAGRVPQLKFRKCLFGVCADLIQDRIGSYEVNIVSGKGYSTTDRGLEVSTLAIRDLTETGPLLGDKQIGQIRYYGMSSTSLSKSTSGLAAITADRHKVLEFRMYSKNILIYASYASEPDPKTGLRYCYDGESSSSFTVSPANGICKVGYVWK